MTKIYTFSVPDGWSIDTIRRSIYDALKNFKYNYSRNDLIVAATAPNVVRVIVFNDLIHFEPKVEPMAQRRLSNCSVTMVAENDSYLIDRLNKVIIEAKDKRKLSIKRLQPEDNFEFTIRRDSYYRFMFRFYTNEREKNNG